MDIVAGALTVLKYAVLGFFGLLAGLFLLVILFGKRIEKRWELEAKFRDERRRELGEFDIELSRVVEKDPTLQADFGLKAKFVLRHPSLELGRSVRVLLGEVVVFDSNVIEAGHILLREADLVGEIKSPQAGDVVSVEIGGVEVFSEALYDD